MSHNSPDVITTGTATVLRDTYDKPDLPPGQIKLDLIGRSAWPQSKLLLHEEQTVGSLCVKLGTV